MASTSETGHAKNLANAELFCNHVIQLSTQYNPSNPNILLTNLQSIKTNSNASQSLVNNRVAPYSLAVDDRELLFTQNNRKISKLRKAYKATQGVTQAQLEDFMTIARRLKGIRKTKNQPTTDSTEEQNHHSTSQMSYDQRTQNYALLISHMNQTPNYAPNEPEYQITTLLAEKDQMLQSTQQVSNTFIPLNAARAQRDQDMYLSQNNLVDTYNQAKDYLFTILDSQSPIYKAIAKLKFKKIGYY